MSSLLKRRLASRRPRENGDPGFARKTWIPAFAGMTVFLAVFGLHAEVLYRVPWTEGLSFTISQAPGDVVTTHIAARNREAVDFGMPEGTSVLAARAGVVTE